MKIIFLLPLTWGCFEAYGIEMFQALEFLLPLSLQPRADGLNFATGDN